MSTEANSTTTQQELEALVRALQRKVNAQADEIEELREEVDELKTRPYTPDSKEEKVGEIVRSAQHLRSDQPVVKLTAENIQQATGVSRRYAYDLMDRLPDEYEWFLSPGEIRQYGAVEMDNGDVRRLGVDFEGVHSAGCPLNLFTTREGSRDRE